MKWRSAELRGPLTVFEWLLTSTLVGRRRRPPHSTENQTVPIQGSGEDAITSGGTTAASCATGSGRADSGYGRRRAGTSFCISPMRVWQTSLRRVEADKIASSSSSTSLSLPTDGRPTDRSASNRTGEWNHQSGPAGDAWYAEPMKLPTGDKLNSSSK